jgi:trans-aconitate 2-methyltransferase
MSWNPAQYLKFAGPRLRPAVDLLSRVSIDAPHTVFDLGCGAGETTALLAARFGAAKISGVDSSPEMLAAARVSFPELTFVKGDITDFKSTPPAHLIYSNAALHWLTDHGGLLPRLLESLKHGGVLAIQMPRVEASPRIMVLNELAADPRWASRVLSLIQPGPETPAFYYDLLAGDTENLDIWESEYLHVLSGKDPVVEWSKGSGAAAVLAALEPGERRDFLKQYSAAMNDAYPMRKDGTTLLPFRRLFIVATRK